METVRKLALAPCSGAGAPALSRALPPAHDDEVERVGAAHPRRGPVAGNAGRLAGLGDGGGAGSWVRRGRGRGRGGGDGRQQGEQRHERSRDAWVGTVRAPLHPPGG